MYSRALEKKKESEWSLEFFLRSYLGVAVWSSSATQVHSRNDIIFKNKKYTYCLTFIFGCEKHNIFLYACFCLVYCFAWSHSKVTLCAQKYLYMNVHRCVTWTNVKINGGWLQKDFCIVCTNIFLACTHVNIR